MGAKKIRHEPAPPPLASHDEGTSHRDLESQILDLQAATRLLRRAQDLAGLATYRVDVDGEVITLSPELCEMYGLEERGVDMPLEVFRERFYHPDDRNPSLAIAEHAYHEGSDFGLTSRVIRGDGRVIWVRSASSVIRDPAGGTQAVGVVEDVSDLMATQVRLAASEAQYRLLAENASDVILRLDADFVIEWASPSVHETLGWHPADLVGKTITDFVSAEGLMRISEVAAVDTGEVIAVDELEVRSSDGRFLTMGSRSRRVLDDGGRVLARVVALRDTSDEVIARRELAASESRYRLLAENMSDFVYQVTYDGVIEWASLSVEQVLGRRPEDLIGTPGVLLFPEEDRATIGELQDLLRFGVDIEPVETRYVTAGGNVRWMEAHARSLRDAGGRVLGAVIGVRDCHDAVLARRAAQTLSAGNAILDRASDEDELLKSMCDAAVDQGGYLFAWYGRLVEGSDKSIQVVAESDEHRSYLDGILVSWDDSDLGGGPVGRSLREVIPVTIDDWDTDESIAEWRPSAISHGFKSSMSLPVKVGDTLDGVLTVYAGERRAFDPRAQESLRDLAVQLGFGLGRLRDIARLEESNGFLLTITDNMVEGLLALDGSGDVIFANAAVAALLKWDVADMIGQNGHRAFHYRRADGSEFPEEECPIFRVLSTGEAMSVDLDYFVRSDGVMMPVAFSASPLHLGASGGVVVVFEDVSEKVAEQQRIDRELDKLTWVGRTRDALEHDRFVLFAQPIVNLATMETIQNELLIRMRDAEGEVIAPLKFLPAAEEFGLIGEIDRWVVTQAVRLAADGHRVEFNLSAKSVADSAMLRFIQRVVEATGAPAQNLMCEITETALMHDFETADRLVRGLADMGIKVALDDFGSGYGGFAYLKRLPVSCLKIDAEFVRDLPHEASSRHVVTAVVNLAEAFGLETVAEGAEDLDTVEILRSLGVQNVQGYAIARPSPVEDCFGA